MALLAKGTVSDRPWGQTLGALAKRGLSGQLTITADEKAYRIAFAQGAVVGATSPLASDAAVRLALTGGLVSSTQVGEITRRIAASPDRDEVDVLAEAARLQPEQAQRLRRRLVAQRAARSFSLDRGDFVIEDEITIPVIPGSELDVRAVINMGARGNLSEARLSDELLLFGVWFKLAPGALEELPQFGFTELDKPVLQALTTGGNLANLTVGHPEVGERGVRAIIYTLACYGACEVSSSEVPTNRPPKPSSGPTPTRGPDPTMLPPRPGSITDAPTLLKAHLPNEDAATMIPSTRAATAPPEGMSLRTPRSTVVPGSRTQTPTIHPVPTSNPRSATGSNLVVPRTPTGNPVSARTSTETDPAVPNSIAQRTPTPQDIAYGRVPTSEMATPATAVGRQQTPTLQPPAEPVISRTISQSRATLPERANRPSTPMPGRSRTNTVPTVETANLIRERLALVDRGADHFNLLGISQEAAPDLIRAAYFTLARKLHPDRLASLGILDRDSQRLMASINAAFAVLNDTVKRTEYMSIVARGGESAVRAEEAKADELAMRVMHAEEAFQRGEMALRREQLDTAMKEFTTAVELQPQEPEYQALFTWTKFAAAADKQGLAHKTRSELQRAAERSEQSPTARFYLGRVERILGREREALDHFREVMRIKPNHQEASSEVRILEARLKKR